MQSPLASQIRFSTSKPRSGLISGTNLQALIDAGLPVTYVLSSRSSAYGLTRASTHDVPSSTCALKTFLTRNPGATRTDYDAEIARLILDSQPDLVVLAGWMHILSEGSLEILSGAREPPGAPALGPPRPSALPNTTEPSASQASPMHHHAQGRTTHFPIPMINLHPALPGAFDGAKAIERAYEAFQKGQVGETGVMVHRVVAEVDSGEPLVVRKVEIRKDDKLEDLEARIHRVEHEIIVEGARMVLQDLDKQGVP